MKNPKKYPGTSRNWVSTREEEIHSPKKIEKKEHFLNGNFFFENRRLIFLGIALLFMFFYFRTLPVYTAGLFRSHGKEDNALDILNNYYYILKDNNEKDFGPPIDIVYTWVNGSHPRQKKGELSGYH